MQPTLREWLKEAPFSLALSAGFFGFFAHTGVLSVLEAEGLAPRALSGASAGALVTGLWNSGVPVPRMREELIALRREHFWDPGFGPGLLRGRLFRAKLESLLAAPSFERSRLPLAISVYDVAARRTEVLRAGPLAPAIHASCAVPGMFHPVRIEGRAYVDGGLRDRPALHGAKEDERIFHHHLISRSPWHRPNSPSLRLPERPQMATLLINGLTRVTPFALQNGRIAYDQAARAFTAALDKPLDRGYARVAA